MKMMKTLLTLLTVGMIAHSAQAAETAKLTKTRLSKSADVQLGVWHAGLSKCRSYAEKNGVPLIAVWSNGDACGHCVMFENACNNAYFKKWMKSSGCVFMFVHSKDSDGAQGGSVYKWCYKNQSLFPFIRVYWYKNGKKQVDTYTMGDTVDGGFSGEKGAKKAVAWFKAKLKNYKYTPVPPTPKYTGGGFDAGDSESDRLEAEIGVTSSISLPLSRTNSVSNTASTNTVRAVYPDGTIKDQTVIWEAGDASTNIVVDTSTLTNADEQVELILLDANGQGVATNHVTAVAPVENSPKNPLWIGEKGQDELGWGEWTMDIDAATNKVAAHNASLPQSAPAGAPRRLGAGEKAYTLLLIGGSVWCPDCFAADEFLFDTDNFREWATNTHRIACVAIDEPRIGGSTPTYDRPCLLSRKPYDSATYGRVSGTGYLSRKGIADADAAAILSRNLNMATNDTLHGGFCLPDNMGGSGNTGKWKTGIPCVILLRGDGSVAGRLFQFSNSTSGISTNDAPALVQRLEELIAQDADADEEKNDSRYTTEATIGDREAKIGKTLSFTDVADFYRLTPATYGKRLSFTVSGESDASLVLKVLKVSKGAEKLETVATNKLNDGVAVGVDVAADTNLSWYVSVSYPTDDKSYPLESQFALANVNSTLCEYTLKTDFVVKPTEVADVNSRPDEDGVMYVQIASNETYRITGLADDAENAACLEKKEGAEDIYRGLVTGDVPLKFAATAVTNQLWHPGKVGFATPSAYAGESSGMYTIRLVRTGGVSGTASAAVTWDIEGSSLLVRLFPNSFLYDPLLDPEKPETWSETFSWAEGEDDAKTIVVRIRDNDFADGDQSICFSAELGGEAEPGNKSFKLTLRDNDARRPGRICIDGANPEPAKGMTAFARAGDSMSVFLGRVDGADGVVAGSLSVSAGSLDETEFEWDGRDTDPKAATLKLPADGKSVTVTLTPAKGTAVDTSRRKLTVNLLAADVPGFETDRMPIEATRYVPIPETRIELDDKATDKTTVKKFSGALPPGLAWKFSDGAVVISGVPTKAGLYKASFRAYTGSVAGLTTVVEVMVVDPVVAGGGEDASEPMNTAVKTSRTFADVPVFSSDRRLAGILTLTIPRTGRLSAKYRTSAAGAVALSCKNWSAFDASDGALSAELSGAAGTNVFALAVVARSDGAVEAVLDDPLHPEGVTCEISANVWSKANPAADFKGYYTVSLPRTAPLHGVLASGDAYMTLKMNTAAAVNAGKFAYAGVLPTGQSFSGSALITPKDWTPGEGFEFWQRALLPVITESSTDVFAGALEIRNVSARANPARRAVYAPPECDIVWRHSEKSAPVEWEATLDAAGGIYTSTENFVTCCNATLGTEKLKLFACGGLNDLDEAFFDDDASDGLELGLGRRTGDESAALADVKVVFTAANAKKKTAAKNAITTSTKGVTFTFALATGLVTGSFKLPFQGGQQTMTFSGVVMPGWGTGGEDCGDCGVQVDTSRPFISGTAWFNDDLAGKKVRRSCPFSVGVAAGK